MVGMLAVDTVEQAVMQCPVGIAVATVAVAIVGVAVMQHMAVTSAVVIMDTGATTTQDECQYRQYDSGSCNADSLSPNSVKSPGMTMMNYGTSELVYFDLMFD